MQSTGFDRWRKEHSGKDAPRTTRQEPERVKITNDVPPPRRSATEETPLSEQLQSVTNAVQLVEQTKQALPTIVDSVLGCVSLTFLSWLFVHAAFRTFATGFKQFSISGFVFGFAKIMLLGILAAITWFCVWRLCVQAPTLRYQLAVGAGILGLFTGGLWALKTCLSAMNQFGHRAHAAYRYTQQRVARRLRKNEEETD
ncbi:MAG: ABC transporter permease [Bdellovibrionota bacterium]